MNHVVERAVLMSQDVLIKPGGLALRTSAAFKSPGWTR